MPLLHIAHDAKKTLGFYLAVFCVISISLQLTACGGGGSSSGPGNVTPAVQTFTISAKIDKLNDAGLVVSIGTERIAVLKDSTTITFPGTLANGVSYDLKIVSQPEGFNRLCAIRNASGTIKNANVTDVSILCGVNPVVVSTIAGGDKYGSANGVGTVAQFAQPQGVAADLNGNIYVADSGNNLIRKIDATGNVVTFAGDGNYGHTDGKGKAARFYSPVAIATDLAGNVYVADAFKTIRKIAPDATVKTIFDSGSGVDALTGVAVDANDNVYVAFRDMPIIKKIDSKGVVSTLAGSIKRGNLDGSGASAQFGMPSGLATDKLGNLYLADIFNHNVRKISPDGVVTTIAGSGRSGSDDGIGSDAQFYLPNALVVDAAGYVFVADRGNHAVRKISPSGVVTTIAGGDYGNVGKDDAIGRSATFYAPSGIVRDKDGNLLVADSGNNRVRKLTLGMASTVDVSTVVVNGVSPRELQLGKSVFISVTGRNLLSDLQFTLDHCENMQELNGGNASLRYFLCTPVGQLGEFNGSLFSIGAGMRTLYNFTFSVQSAFNSIAPIRSRVAIVKRDGSLWAWGNGLQGNGQLSATQIPVKIAEGFESVAVSDGLSLGIKKDGSLWGWGISTTGLFGGVYQSASPIFLGSGYKKVAIGACGRPPEQVNPQECMVGRKSEYALALKTDGSLWAWGYGSGVDKNKMTETTPRLIDTGYRDIAVSSSTFSLGVKTDNSVWMWSIHSGIANQTGFVFTKIADGFSEVSAGYDAAFGIKLDGSLWSLLNSSNNFSVQPLTANLRQIGAGFKSISAGYFYLMALKADGTLWAQGSNEKGQFGDNSFVSSSTLKLVNRDVNSITASDSCSMIQKNTGAIWAWGACMFGNGHADVNAIPEVINF